MIDNPTEYDNSDMKLKLDHDAFITLFMYFY